MNKRLILLLIFINCLSAKSQFKGGGGDGFAVLPTYSQAYINMYFGGKNDGFATAFYNQVGVPLPIILVTFTGKNVANHNQLNWKTSTEINASHFEIERSSDAKKFDKIGNKQLNESKNYEFTDLAPQPPMGEPTSAKYYRLKLLDLDGKYQYSKIISIANDGDSEIVGQFYPNPSDDGFSNIIISANGRDEWKILHFDIYGKLVKSESRLLEKGINKILIKELQNGLNIFEFKNGENSFIRKVTR